MQLETSMDVNLFSLQINSLSDMQLETLSVVKLQPSQYKYSSLELAETFKEDIGFVAKGITKVSPLALLPQYKLVNRVL